MDRYYIDGENLYTYNGYDVTDFMISYTNQTKNGAKWGVGFDIKNVFNEHYSQAIWNDGSSLNYAVSAPRTFWLRLNFDM